MGSVSASDNSVKRTGNRETNTDEVMDTLMQEDPSYDLLKKKITEDTGFNCEYYKEAHFRRRINVRVRATSSDSYIAYIKLLKKNPEEYERLLDTLTVNVSEFFRNPEVFRLIENEIIPSIVKYGSESSIKSIRVWSAGCASGEEAYSLAILFHRFLKPNFEKYRIDIIGTDIDSRSLEKAKKGIYNESSLKNVSSNIKDNYFLKNGDKYQITDQLKKLAHFKHHDLISGPKIKQFDIIICRNVMIYFKKEIQEQLQLNFYQSLEKGGFFIIGKAETLLSPASSLFKTYSSRERLYVKENLIETSLPEILKTEIDKI